MDLYLLNYDHTKHRQNGKKPEVEGREFRQVRAGFSGIVGGELAEGDQTCEGGNDGSRATDIHAQKKSGIVSGKLGKQNGGGNVADDLAGKCADQQCVLFQQRGKQIIYRRDTCQIARKNKEANKGQE